jgi:hypothetical protein
MYSANLCNLPLPATHMNTKFHKSVEVIFHSAMLVRNTLQIFTVLLLRVSELCFPAWEQRGAPGAK